MILRLAKNKSSLFAIGFIFFSTLLINFSHHRWQQEDKIIEWDIKSYYAYLPATFIYQDLSLDFIHDESGKFKDLIWPIETPLKKKAIITTMGMSILYAPFLVWLTFMLKQAIMKLMAILCLIGSHWFLVLYFMF